jgi:hypothetical protein
MAINDKLLELEKQFWTGDAEFYRSHVAARRASIIGTSQRWK